MDRRNFIKSVALMAAFGAVSGESTVLHAAPRLTEKERIVNIRNYNPAMRYRPMGQTGVDVSALGFGMLRLPTLADSKTVDEAQSVEMVRYAIDHGLNYVDTAYAYLGGQSERTVGKALQNGYRDKVYITSKSPWRIMEHPEDFERMFDESRRRMQSDVIDFYHIHFVTGWGWKNTIAPFKLIEKMEKLKLEGKIRFSGFSFHDSVAVFKRVIDANPDWNFCLIQQNYLDTENEAGLIGLKYAAARGLGVSIMKPLRTGFLAAPPKEVQAILDSSDSKRSAIEWALDYLWNMPEVSVVVSGMSNIQQVKQNLAYAGRSSAGMFSVDDVATIGRVAKRYREYDGMIPCTGCNNCVASCPERVSVGYILALVYNQYKADGNKKQAQASYNSMDPKSRGNKASACVQCGKCLPACPQEINIPQVLQKVKKELEDG